MRNHLPHTFLFLFFLSFFAVGAALPTTLFSQGPNTTTITSEPRYPGRGEEVRLQFTSYETNLGAADISWYRDGTLIEQGRGLRNVTITAPDTGERQRITAIAKTPSGTIISGEYALNVNQVTMVLGAQTHVPPFYKGRALPTIGGRTEIHVFPELFSANGQRLDPARFMYAWWSDGGSIEGEDKAIGKRSAVLHNPYYARDIRVVVTVTDPSTGATGEGVVTVRRHAPKVLLYENHPLWGMWFNATLPVRFTIDKVELSVTAEPYNFPTTIAKDALIYEWLVPGINAPFRSDGGSLVFKPESEYEGNAFVTLTVKTGKIPEQIATINAKTSFTAEFNASALRTAASVNEQGLPVF